MPLHRVIVVWCHREETSSAGGERGAAAAVGEVVWRESGGRGYGGGRLDGFALEVQEGEPARGVSEGGGRSVG